MSAEKWRGEVSADMGIPVDQGGGHRLGWLGTGRMGEALVTGLVTRGGHDAATLCVVDPDACGVAAPAAAPTPRAKNDESATAPPMMAVRR